MKKLFVFVVFLLMVGSCEKDAVDELIPAMDNGIPALETSDGIEFRSNDTELCDMLTEMVEAFEIEVAGMETELGHGPTTSILVKLQSIKKKLEQCKLEVVLEKLNGLRTHLEELAMEFPENESIFAGWIENYINEIVCEITQDCLPAIGDIYEGGYVFYLADPPVDLDGNGTQDRGLIAALEDYHDGTNYRFTWFEAMELYPPLLPGDNPNWFLPSKDQLNWMWVNLNRFGCDATPWGPPNYQLPDPCATSIGGFANEEYWSSTQDWNLIAWFHNFYYGNQYYYFLEDGKKFRVRTARAF